MSKLLYCSTVWANTCASNIKKLQAIQNYACRIITNTRKFDQITPALHDLKWLPIDLQLLYRGTVMTFKCINDLAPPYLCSKFKKRSAIHHQSTPNSDTLNIPLFRTTSGQRSFSYRGVKIWNNLDKELREITSLHHFKRRLKSHLFKEYYGS